MALEDVSRRPKINASKPNPELESFPPVHRNYQKMSTRSPDDFSDDEDDESDDISAELAKGSGSEVQKGLSDQESSQASASTRSGAAAVSDAAAMRDAPEAAFLGRGGMPASASPVSGTKMKSPGDYRTFIEVLRAAPWQHQCSSALHVSS